MNETRLLVVNAEDFGRSASANEATMSAARDGIVTSASLMVFGDAAEDAAALALAQGSLSVGLHFDAGEWALRDGEWITVYERVALDDEASIAHEVRTQLERFHSLMGRKPTHLDSHQHVLRRPMVKRALRRLASQLGIPLQGSAPGIIYVGIVERDVDEQRRRTDLQRLQAIVRSMPDGVTVINCHPDMPGRGGSPCCMDHPTSLAALCDESLRKELDEHHVALVSFAELSASRERIGELIARGHEQIARGEVSDAIRTLRIVLRLSPNEAPAWLALAHALGVSGELDRAIDAAHAALAHHPGWPAALWRLAALLWRAGQTHATRETVSALCAATRIDSRPGTHARIVLHALTSGCSSDVVSALLEAQIAFPDGEAAPAISPMELGRQAFARRELELAEGIFRGVEQSEGVRPWTSLWIARTLQAQGRIKEAFATLASGMALNDDRRMLSFELADMLGRQGELERAIELLDGLHRREPFNAELAATVARRLIDLGAYDKAASVADAHATTDPACLTARAIARWHGGDGDEAERLVEDANAGLADRERAELALAIGRPLSAWSRLRDNPREWSAGNIVYRSAHALRRNGHLTTARDAFAAAATTESSGAAEWLERTEGEIRLLSGGWTPPHLPHMRFDPIEGRVLNIVGKSLPHTQSGYTIRTHYLARTQREIGLEPFVVTQLGYPWTVDVDDASEHDVVDGVEYHRLLPSSGVPERLDELTAVNIAHLADIVTQLRPSVLQAASDFRNPLMATAIGRHFGLPVIYAVRGFWQETWLSKRSDDALTSDAYRWRGERELECMHGATHIVTIAETMREQMIASGIDEDKITVIPNAVDPDAFHPVDRDDELAHRLGIEDGEIVLGYISSFSGYEGITYLIDAVAELLARGHRVRLLLVGDGEERARLEARARERGIADRTIFTGRVPHDDVLAYYSIIDIFVVPRTADRVSKLVTPLKPYEAMATERVVIVSNVPALREMIVEGVTGLAFEPERSDSLAAAIEPLLTDTDRRRELGRAARRWVCANRTWRANGARLAEMYERLGVASMSGA